MRWVVAMMLVVLVTACGDDGGTSSGADAGLDSGIADGGARDAGVDLGSVDGGDLDGGDVDGGPTPSPRLQAITSGGGRAASPMYRARIRVGGPAPHQSLQSPSYRLRPLPAGGTR